MSDDRADRIGLALELAESAGALSRHYFEDGTLAVTDSPAHEDGAWITLCGPGRPRPLQAAVQAVDPMLDVEVTGSATSWAATLVPRSEPAVQPDEVAVTRFSSGASFAFQPRTSIPITPV